MKASGRVSFLALTFLFAFSSCKNAKPSMQWTNEKIGPAFTLASDLNKATSCEVLRVDDAYPNKREAKKNSEDLHGYALLSKAVAVRAKSRRTLSAILSNPKTYIQYEEPPDCSFRPGIAFRFADGRIQVDLLICFSCSELRYYLNDEIVGTSFFRSSELGSLVKELFPDDKKIQSLK
tara:strand:- start:193 stop:726 length:534 start_codon:yes stop_codon:yes gene_type:complete